MFLNITVSCRIITVLATERIVQQQRLALWLLHLHSEVVYRRCLLVGELNNKVGSDECQSVGRCAVTRRDWDLIVRGKSETCYRLNSNTILFSHTPVRYILNWADANQISNLFISAVKTSPSYLQHLWVNDRGIVVVMTGREAGESGQDGWSCLVSEGFWEQLIYFRADNLLIWQMIIT